MENRIFPGFMPPALLITALLLSSCQLSSNTRPVQGKSIRVARASEPEWLNPVAGHQHADSDMAASYEVRIFGHGTSPLWNIEAWSTTRDGKV